MDKELGSKLLQAIESDAGHDYATSVTRFRRENWETIQGQHNDALGVSQIVTLIKAGALKNPAGIDKVYDVANFIIDL